MTTKRAQIRKLKDTIAYLEADSERAFKRHMDLSSEMLSTVQAVARDRDDAIQRRDTAYTIADQAIDGLEAAEKERDAKAAALGVYKAALASVTTQRDSAYDALSACKVERDEAQDEVQRIVDEQHEDIEPVDMGAVLGSVEPGVTVVVNVDGPIDGEAIASEITRTLHGIDDGSYGGR